MVKEIQSCSFILPDFRNHFKTNNTVWQGHKRQKMKQKMESKNKPTHLWSIGFQKIYGSNLTGKSFFKILQDKFRNNAYLTYMQSTS